MTQKQREEIERIYFELLRAERRLANIVEAEEKKWHNLNGKERSPQDTPIANLVHDESFDLADVKEHTHQGIKALKIAISFFEFSQKAMNDLRPKK